MYTYTCTHVHVHIQICCGSGFSWRIHKHIYIYIHIYIHVHTYIHTHTCTKILCGSWLSWRYHPGSLLHATLSARIRCIYLVPSILFPARTCTYSVGIKLMCVSLCIRVIHCALPFQVHMCSTIFFALSTRTYSCGIKYKCVFLSFLLHTLASSQHEHTPAASPPYIYAKSRPPHHTRILPCISCICVFNYAPPYTHKRTTPAALVT